MRVLQWLMRVLERQKVSSMGSGRCAIGALQRLPCRLYNQAQPMLEPNTSASAPCIRLHPNMGLGLAGLCTSFNRHCCLRF